MTRKGLTRFTLAIIGLYAVAPTPARGQLDVGSDGSDGVFNPTSSVEIDLGLAATATWDTPSPMPGKGVYDPEKWAVVFKYSSVTIPNGVTVTFKNHPTRAPVVWLVQNSVTISGTVNLDGKTGISLAVAESGPGGFRGGRAGSTGLGSGGFGPGGGDYQSSSLSAQGGSYGSVPPSVTFCGLTVPAGGPPYGNPQILPLIGGSGGSLKWDVSSLAQMGGGGGAILIAAASNIQVPGTIRAVGGTGVFNDCGVFGGSGSGGAIRLIADTVSGTGALMTRGGSTIALGAAGSGRIRIEGNAVGFTGQLDTTPTIDIPNTPPKIWLSDDAPRVRLVSVGGAAAPTDPHADLGSANADLSLATAAPQTLIIEAENMPLTWNVVIRVVRRAGPDAVVAASFLSGTASLSTWQATVSFSPGVSALQVRAAQP